MCQNSVARPYLFTHRDRHKHKHNLYKTRSHPPNCNQPLRLSGQLPCCHNQKPPCFFPECLTHFATFAHSEPNTLSAWSIYKYFFLSKTTCTKTKNGKRRPKERNLSLWNMPSRAFRCQGSPRLCKYYLIINFYNVLFKCKDLSCTN